MVTYLLENEIFRFLELQLLFSGGMGYAEMAIYPPKSRFPIGNHGFLYDGISAAPGTGMTTQPQRKTY